MGMDGRCETLCHFGKRNCQKTCFGIFFVVLSTKCQRRGLFFASKFASKIFISWMSYDIHDAIEKDNVAAGVSFAGAIIAIGIITMNAIIDPFVDWTSTLANISIQTVLGCILLPIMRVFADKILLPGQKLTDEIVNQEKPNIGAGLIEAFAYIASAILITWSI
jgi:uncharacterized membrane protein YjfL (UPF0719 family)